MKKIMILMAVACLVLVSCGNQPKATEPVAEEKCCKEFTEEQKEMFANWENWAELDEDAQVALVADMKLFLDECKAKCAEKCEKKCAEKEEGAEPKEVCPEKKAKCEEKKAKCEEFKAKWEAFDELTLEEKKCMIDQVLACKAKKCCKDKEGKEGCEKKCEKKCEKHENAE